MLEDLIKKLKAMLGQSDDSEGLDDEDEKTGVFSKKDLVDEDEDDEDDEVAKKKTMIIRGIVIIAVIFFTVDEFFLSEDAPPAISKKSNKRKLKRKSPKKKVKKISDTTTSPKKLTATKEKIEALPDSSLQATPEVTVAATPEPTMEITPEVTIDVTPDPTMEKTPEPTMEMTPEPTMEKTPEPTMEITPEATVEMTPEATVEVTPEATASADDSVDSILSDLDQSIPDASKSSADGLGALGAALNKLKPEKNNEKLSIPKPPDYLIIGRGLVYNCTGKHWACVDKKSYFICLKNYKASKQSGVKAECSVVAIYGSDEDCQVIQTYNVNTSQPTGFCSK